MKSEASSTQQTNQTGCHRLEGITLSDERNMKALRTALSGVETQNIRTSNKFNDGGFP
jgi:hypothetical protein